MTFETNLTTFNFNKETMELLLAEGSKTEEVLEMMESVGFSKDLTSFLMSVKDVDYNSIMMRTRLYVKMGKSFDSVKHSFDAFPSSVHLVKHLYGETSAVEPVAVEPVAVEPVAVEPVKQVKQTKQVVVEDETSLLENDIVESDNDSEEADSDSESGDPFEQFFDQCVKKEQGGKIKTKEGYEFFLKWYNQHFSESDEPDKNEFKEYLNQRIGKKWKDYVLVH